MSIECSTHQQLNMLLTSLFTEQNLIVPADTRLSFGMDSGDESGELRFVVENDVTPQCEAPVSQVLNREGLEYVIDSFIALEQQLARDKAEVIQAAGNGFFKQEFALKYDGKDWQLDIRLYPVSLCCA